MLILSSKTVLVYRVCQSGYSGPFNNYGMGAVDNVKARLYINPIQGSKGLLLSLLGGIKGLLLMAVHAILVC